MVQTRPDLAFLDIRMPGIDGLALAQVFGARQKTRVLGAFDGEDLVVPVDNQL